MKNKIKVEHLFLIYIIIQPFLDIYTNYFKHPFEIFGLSINVLINLLLTFIIIVFYIKKLLKTKKSNKKIIKKDFIISIIYICIFIIYSILHYYNMQQFDERVFSRHSYGYIKETYYIFRCYILPIILLFTLYRLNISKNKIILAIKISVFIICFIVVGTNIFGVSLASYAEHGKLIYIDGNIFHWPFFDGNDNFDLYTSKGWFHSANELSAILISFTPFIIYSYLLDKDDKKSLIFDTVNLLLLVITMNMLGTRTASFGLLAILVCSLVIYLFFIVVKKYKINLKQFIFKFSILSFICILLFFISPFYNDRYGKFKSEFKERPLKKEEDKTDVKMARKDFVEYMDTHYWYFYIEKDLLDIYPVDNDESFWRYIINRDLRLNSNYRIMKTDIYNRIIKKNNNSLDKYLGIGYNDILTNEKDYSIHMYQFGLFGILVFMGPYFSILIYCVYRIIRNFKNLFNVEIIIVLMGNVIALIVPYLTGHVFGIVFPMTYIILNLLLILRLVDNKEKVKDNG